MNTKKSINEAEDNAVFPIIAPIFFDKKGREIIDGCTIWNPADRNPEQSVKLIDGELWFGAKGTLPNECSDWCKLDRRYVTEKFWLIVS